MKTPTRLLPKLVLFALTGLVSVLGNCSHAQDVFNASGGSGVGGVIPASYQGSGSFFNRQLGTVMRFSYHNNGYGPQDDIVTLGSMKVFNLEGATFFLDGQATLSENFGGGFNAGIGYRQLVDTGIGFDAQRILGVSFWTDGQSTRADNFFTQLGFNLESLGEWFDARIGGYFPLERTKFGDAKLTALNDPMFLGNNLVSEAFIRSVDTSHSVVDGELAKRLGNLEAWAFLGGYQLGGGSIDTTGYRAGVRGYAMPDLLLSLQVTDDDVYHTNVMFGLTWFVGRTHRCNQPTGTLLDRFREPVQRNDFIVTTQVSEMVAGGDPLRDATTGDDLRFVHVDSGAAAGGDGTFENPLTSFVGAPAASLDNDTVLVHAGSAFGGQYALKEGQRVIGEGGGIVHTTNTLELGVINLPETSLGALAGTVPVIAGVGDVFTMADNTEVNNFTINGGTRAVVADAVASPTLRNLTINNPTGDGVTMTNITGTGTNSDLTIATTAGTGFLADGSGTINATGTNTISTTTGVGLDLSNVSIDATNFTFESVNVTNGSTTGINLDTLDGAGQVILGSGINAGDGGTLTVAGTAIRLNSVDNVTFSNMTVNNTAVGSNGVVINSIFGDEAFFSGLNITTEATGFSSIGGGELSVTGTNTISTQTGTGLRLDSNVIDAAGVTFDSVTTTAGTGAGIDLKDLLTGTVTVGPNTGVNGAGGTMTTAGTAISVDNVAGAAFSDITVNNTTGPGVNVTGQTTGSVSFSNLDVTTTTGAGVNVAANTGGTIAFDDLNVTTTTGDAVVVDNNTGATVTINDMVVNSTVSGAGLTASNGGLLSVTGTNTINTVAGVGLNLSDVTILAAGATFQSVDVTAGATNGIALQNLTGGTVTVGPNTGVDGAGGTMTTAGTAISVDNVAGAAFNDITVANTTGPGVNVTGQTAGSVSFNNLDATTTTAAGVNVAANTGGTIAFDDLNVTTTTGDAVVIDNNTGATVTINDMIVNSTVSGAGLTASNGGTLSVTGTNTISTAAGVGLNLSDVTILATGATFQSIDVTTGATNGIALQNLTGGTVTVGPNTGVDGAGGTMTTAGTAISVDNVAGAAFNDITVNNTVGTGVNVTAQTVGSVLFNNLDVTTTAGVGVNVAANTGGTIAFDDLNVMTTTGNAVVLDNNTGAAISINGMVVSSTVSGNGLTASNGGLLSVTGTNTINTVAGVGLNLSDVTILAAGATFQSVDVTAGATNGIALQNLTGGTVTVGPNTGVDGAGGTMTTAGTAVSVSNVASAAFNDIAVNNTAGTGVNVTAQTAGSVLFNNLDVTTTIAAGVTASANAGGSITFNQLDVGTTDGNAVVLGTNTGTTLNFSNMTLNSTGTGNGFAATGGGTLNVTGTNTIATDTGQVLDIANQTIGASGVTIDTVNTVTGATNAIELDTLVGSFVRIGSGVAAGAGGTLIASDTAIRVTDVDDVTFNNITINNTAVNSDGVIVANSVGDRAFFSGINITSERTGFSATGGELAVTGTNTISTTSGPALDLNNLTVNIAGVTFDNASVSAGTGTGIELENLTGGTVTIGPNTGVDGAGGTLVTASTSISVTNVESAVFNDVTATSSADDTVTVDHTNATDSDVQFDNLTATSTNDSGVVVAAAGAGELDVTLRDSTVGSSGTEQSVSIVTNAGSGRVDFTLQNNAITAEDSNAFAATLSGGSGDVRFLLDDTNVFTNDSAASATLDVSVTTALELNATIEDNTFTNNNAAGTAFNMVLNDPADTGTIDLNLNGNTANDGVGDFYDLENLDTAGSFRVVDGGAADGTTVNANNTGTVNFSPNAAAFDFTITDLDVELPD